MKYQISHSSITEYQPDIAKLEIDQLPSILDNSIEKIDLYHILELQKESLDTIRMVLSKLRLRGVAAIIGVDVNKVCEFYLENYLSLTDLESLLLNKQKFFTLSTILGLLREAEAKVLSLKTDKLLYYIEFGRNINEN